MNRLRIVLLALVASAALGSASPAGAWYQRYVQNAIFTPGSLAGSSYNSITFNATQFSNAYGGTPYMGTTLQRSDGSSYSFLWSNSGSIFDSRHMAYGHAICEAQPANQYQVYVDFCDTGNT